MRLAGCLALVTVFVGAAHAVSLFIDSGGRCDVARYVSGNTRVHAVRPRVGVVGDRRALWSTRYSLGDMAYRIPVGGRGPYALKLYFFENYHRSTPGYRRFAVRVNGQLANADLDIMKRAGGLYKPFIITARNVYARKGAVTVRLVASRYNNPVISAISLSGAGAVVPGTPECAIRGRRKPQLPGGNSVRAAKYRYFEMGPLVPWIRATRAVVILHGMSMKPEDLRALGWAGRIRLGRTRFIFVRAPKAYVTYLKKRTESWFDVRRRVSGQEDVPSLRASAAGVANIVRGLQRKYGIASKQVVVVGMSQGGAVGITMYLAERLKLAGVIGLGTWLPLPNRWESDALPSDNSKTPLTMFHGTADKSISIIEARRSVATLRALGRPAKLKEYRGASHSFRGFWAVLTKDALNEAKRMLEA